MLRPFHKNTKKPKTNTIIRQAYSFVLHKGSLISYNAALKIWASLSVRNTRTIEVIKNVLNIRMRNVFKAHCVKLGRHCTKSGGRQWTATSKLLIWRWLEIAENNDKEKWYFERRLLALLVAGITYICYVMVHYSLCWKLGLAIENGWEYKTTSYCICTDSSIVFIYWNEIDLSKIILLIVEFTYIIYKQTKTIFGWIDNKKKLRIFDTIPSKNVVYRFTGTYFSNLFKQVWWESNHSFSDEIQMKEKQKFILHWCMYILLHVNGTFHFVRYWFCLNPIKKTMVIAHPTRTSIYFFYHSEICFVVFFLFLFNFSLFFILASTRWHD